MLFVILVLAIVLLAGFLIGGLLGAPWVPAYKRDVDGIIKDMKLKKGQLYIELGCGDGRLLAAAAPSGARCIGYEINPVMWLAAWLRNARRQNVSVHLANFWPKDLSRADVVTVFLMPKFMPRLEAKLKREMKPNSRFISYVFKLPTKKPEHARDRWFVYKF